MHVAAIHSQGFRNLEGRLPLSHPLSVVLGPNNSGKSNLIDACRVLFSPEAGPRARHWITSEDFTHDAHGHRVVDQLTLEAELVDLTEADRGRMITCLSNAGESGARIGLRAHIGATGRVQTEWFGGDSANTDIERWAREAVTFAYLHPLRDAGADLRPGRDNRIGHLLETIAPQGHDDRGKVEKIVDDANELLVGVGAVSQARDRIRDRFTQMTGSGPLSQQSTLAFADPEYTRVVASLRALAGHNRPLELAENGLGYNNLLYMSVLLAALAQSTEPGTLRVLLVEEPEAHLHPQLQDLLMRYLEEQSTSGTQVLMTSHSPNLASSARVERITVLARTAPDTAVLARRPAVGLEARRVAHLRRFLDVTKSSLLFSRGVVLVEGIAEQLLLPVIARRLGRPLATSGITVVNIGGVAFDPFIALFGPDRLPVRCAVITDADPPKIPRRRDAPEHVGEAPASEVIDLQVDPMDDSAAGEKDDDIVEDDDETDLVMSPRAARLLQRQHDTLHVYVARQTLEWDLAMAENTDLMLLALESLRPRLTRQLRRELPAESAPERAQRLLDAVAPIKGDFAQALSDLLTETVPANTNGASGGTNAPAHPFHCPPYFKDAITWITDKASPDSPGRAPTTGPESGS